MSNTILRRRTRMISFRVSEREFELLKTRSEAEGAHSVSEFARLALCRSGTEGAQEPLIELTGTIQQLRADVQRVTELLEGPPRAFPEPIAISPIRRKV